MRLSARLGLIALGLAVMIGCGQSTSNELSSPVAPGPVSESLAAAPGTGYDASGVWVGVFEVVQAGESFEEEVEFNQDAEGNITFLDGEGFPVTLTRVGPGNGRVIAYRVSSTGDVAQCTETASGTVTIDTQTNTGRGQILFVEEDCFRGTAQVTLTKK